MAVLLDKITEFPGEILLEILDYIPLKKRIQSYILTKDDLFKKSIRLTLRKRYNLNLSDLPTNNDELLIFFEKFSHHIYDKNIWNKISNKTDLPTVFIDTYASKLDWYIISREQKLCEKILIKYVDKINWLDISRYQNLSIDFIDKYAAFVDWYYISKYQKLTPECIEKFSHKINLWNLKNNVYRLK